MKQKQTDRNNMLYRRRIEWLKQYAPKMPLDIATQDAEKLLETENENTKFREAILVLLIDVLGIVAYYKKFGCVDGNYTRKTNGRFYCNPAHCSMSWKNKTERDRHLRLAYAALS